MLIITIIFNLNTEYIKKYEEYYTEIKPHNIPWKRKWREYIRKWDLNWLKKYFNIYSIKAPEPYCEVDIIVTT